MRKKLTLVVPVYNVEKYVARCLNSIISQMTDDCELVVVNDGSLDNSLNIVNDILSHTNCCYSVITKENHGIASARNTGIENSGGEYIWFIDSDDYILPDSVANILKAIDDDMPDLIAFNYAVEYANNSQQNASTLGNDVVPYSIFLVTEKALYVWRMIYKRTALAGVRFLDDLRNIEDTVFNMEIGLHICHINTYEWICYVYNQTNMNSISRNRSTQHLVQLYEHSIIAQSYLLGKRRDVGERLLMEEWDAKLNEGFAGTIYSLIRFYNWHFVKRAIKTYKRLGVYPLKNTRNKRANVFIFVANHKCLLGLYGLYTKLRKK